MKICFLLQRRFARVGHALAINIKRERPETEFCAYVGLRSNLTWLKTQKEIDYTGFILDEDLNETLYREKLDLKFLDNLEKEIGLPNLWPYLYIDRVLMNGQLLRAYPYNKPTLNRDDMLRALQAGAKKIEAFLIKEKPDAIIMTALANLGTLLLYTMGQKMGVRTLTVEGARIKNYNLLSEDYRTFTDVNKIFEATLEGKRKPAKIDKAREFIKEFRQKPVPYHKELAAEFNTQKSLFDQIRFLQPINLLRSIAWHTKNLYEYLTKSERDYTDESIFWLIWDKIQRKTRNIIGFKDLYSPFNPNVPYTFFALHYEPEMALMLRAPLYAEQVSVIKQIARALPIDHILYVKEHPIMIGYRTREFYKEILKAPNVRLLDPLTPGTEVVKSAKLIVTINGTSAWEAILLKIPVISFGDVYYNKLSFVRRCHSYEELARLVKEQLGNFKHNERELELFVNALIEDSVQTNIGDLWTKDYTLEQIVEDASLKRFAKLITSKVYGTI
ncbi:MAG TPA: hypothetical protein VJI73_01825 [Candidatus Paceibacterota bacterium]